MATGLTLSDRQVETLAVEGFLRKMIRILTQSDPKAGPVLDTAEGQQTLRQQYERARGYGLETERDLGRYIVTAWTMGIDFDRRFPAMSQILNDPALTPTEKADGVERTALTLFALLAEGPKDGAA
ncbi:hypothetical protein ACCD06_17585 [Azospirillum sp. CT11-132]|jgi:hypothetical protein|uniref:hypothetical protein n=1 Tax=unclassified Azospirillum TaxID=2630922 RepID=UPI000D6072F4|nr:MULTISPECIES: hypothetical protein [unclassified Azospirillum]PWC54248.1 hypothetical protein TSH7_31425 [Azospirillum sp. TSH7]PWC64771.1 hypothetical protein TSH20_17920 [Azospirillum sp. TSH20]QCG97701.1 hypothetical protein E6C67_28605 [Azospirillum sp. TSA2s]